MASGLPVRRVDVNSETKAFWDATVEGRLMLPKCNDCHTVIWYPRGYCPACSSMNVSWTQASGHGTVYTFSITRNGAGPWKLVGPYVVAYVELEEGPRVLTNIVGCGVDEVTIGMAVQVVFDDTGEGMSVFRFEPVR